MRDFEYTPEWYADSVEWLSGVHSGDDLREHFERPPTHPEYAERWERWFEGAEIRGRVLELGFNSGATIYRLCKMFPGVTVDGIDWNEKLRVLEPWLREIAPGLGELWFGDCNTVDRPDCYYDCVTSINFYEHLPVEAYYASITMCYRLLVPGGYMFVYLGKPKQPAHINLRSDSRVCHDMLARGFEFVRKQRGLMVFRKPD